MKFASLKALTLGSYKKFVYINSTVHAQMFYSILCQSIEVT